MKFISTLIASAVLLGATISSNAGTLDNWNAQLNTPQSKAEFFRKTCARDDSVGFNLCERMKRTGVPDSDVRIGIAGAGLVVGAGAGMVAAAVPFTALGGKTVVGYLGVKSVFGLAPTVAVMGATGAATGLTVFGLGAAVTP